MTINVSSFRQKSQVCIKLPVVQVVGVAKHGDIVGKAETPD